MYVITKLTLGPLTIQVKFATCKIIFQEGPQNPAERMSTALPLTVLVRGEDGVASG